MNTNFTFIKDSEASKRLTPEFMDAFDAIMPLWIDRYIPAYKLCKEKGVSIFEIANVINDWSPNYKFENGGFHYILEEDASRCKTMSFDGNYKPLGHIGWLDMMRQKFPDLYKTTPDYKGQMASIGDFSAYHWYMSRLHNPKPPYDYVANKVNEYFQMTTGDKDASFDFGSTSYIVLDQAGRNKLNQWRFSVRFKD